MREPTTSPLPNLPTPPAATTPVAEPVLTPTQPKMSDKPPKSLIILMIVVVVLIIGVLGFLLFTVPGRVILGIGQVDSNLQYSSSSTENTSSTSSETVDQTIDSTLNLINSSSSSSSIDTFDAGLEFNAQ